MSQQFVKGFTNNHLTWVMVDATDFATPESALSAVTKIKIYGKLKSATGVNFVSSGTGSLTNDIFFNDTATTEIYTIALAKADLSDASAAWYDQYVINLSATGAAYQTIVVDGGIWISDLSAVASDIRSDVSDMHSDLIVMSGILSDTYSAVLLTQSLVSDAHSAAVVAQALTASDMSDIASRVWSAKYTAHSTASSFGSLISDIYSRVALAQSMASDAASAAQQANSRILVTQSLASDAYSAAVVAQSISTSDMSDIRSAITGVTATITASDISDIASAVWAAKYTTHSAASSFGSLLSDIYSRVVFVQSVASDAASAATQANSRVLLNQSRLSDVYSMLSDLQSDFQSRVPKAVATNSQLSDVASDLVSDLKSFIGAGVTVASGGITTASFAAGAIDAAALAQGAAQEVADEVLNRNLAGGGSGHTRNVRNALRGLRNKAVIAANELTVYQEDDLTVAWSAATSTAAGNPLVKIDPD